MKHIVRSISRSHSHCGFFILPVAIFSLALPLAQGQVCPNPPGGCGNQNTAVGDSVLSSLTTGVWNVGVGFEALHNDADGNQNTAIGFQALFNNVSGNKSTAIGAVALFSNTA